MSKRSEIPQELRGKISAFDSALNNVESEFEPLLKMSQVELNSEVNSGEELTLILYFKQY